MALMRLRVALMMRVSDGIDDRADGCLPCITELYEIESRPALSSPRLTLFERYTRLSYKDGALV